MFGDIREMENDDYSGGKEGKRQQKGTQIPFQASFLFCFFLGGEVIQFSESPFVARVLRLSREGREDEIGSLWQQGGTVGQLDRKNRRKRKALERKKGEGGSPTHGQRGGACRVRSTLSREEKRI